MFVESYGNGYSIFYAVCKLGHRFEHRAAQVGRAAFEMVTGLDRWRWGLKSLDAICERVKIQGERTTIDTLYKGRAAHARAIS